MLFRDNTTYVFVEKDIVGKKKKKQSPKLYHEENTCSCLYSCNVSSIVSLNRRKMCSDL